MAKEYDNTNRLSLFATNARSNKAPSHSGSFLVSKDMLEETDEKGVYIVSVTAWAHEEGHIFGVLESHSEKQKAYEEYKASRSKSTKSRTKK